MNETLRTVGGRSVLTIERRLTHPPEKVWRAITEPAHLAAWFPSNVEMDLRPGGRVRFVFPDGEGPESEGVVQEIDPPRVLAYTWSDNVLRYELHAEDGGCLLIFTNTFDDRAGAASFASGWQVCFQALALVLDGRPVEIDHPLTLHESYVRQFGLDEGSSEDTPTGWQVRFERQLTRPAEDVWARLGAAGPDTPVVGGRVPHGFTTADVPAGVITEVQAPTVLEYEWLADDGHGGGDTGVRASVSEPGGGDTSGRVRWELGEGTGHGARLFVIQTGSTAHAGMRSTALDAWRSHVERLAGQLLSAPVPPPSAARGTLTTTDDDRYALRFERTFAHPPEKVWRALTEREHLLAWFPAAVDLDVPVGAEITFVFPAGRAAESSGTILRSDPPKLLEHTWDDEVLRWELRPDDDGGGCQVVFTHVFDDRDSAGPLAGGWHAGLEVLEAALDVRHIDWSVWDRDAELKREYADGFVDV